MSVPSRLADLHTHCKLCRHAFGEPEEFLAAAIRNDLAFYGISDHLPAPQGFDQKSRMNPPEYPQYREIVSQMKKQAEGTGTEVLYACELDYVPGRMQDVAQFIEHEDFDYIIGSIHYVADLPIDNHNAIPEMQAYGMDALWEQYMDMMCEFVSTFPVNIIGHLDLMKIFGFRHSDPAVTLRKMQSVLELCAAKGIMIEINTAGLRKPVKEMYPAPELLKLANRLGVGLTFGSDAHKPEQIAMDFDGAVELAKSAGYRCIHAFRKRTPIVIPFQ